MQINDNQKILTAYTFLILAQVMVGVNIVGTKYLVDSVPILFILAIRFLLAALMLFFLYVSLERRSHHISASLKTLGKKDWFFMIAQAVTAGVLFNCFMIWGLRYTNANVAGIITSGLPAIIAVMSWIVLREHFSRKTTMCVGLATVGLIIISIEKFSTGGGEQSALGNLLVFLSLLPEAAYYVLSKMYRNKLPIFLLSAILHGINAIILLPILFLYIDWELVHLASFDWAVLCLISASSALFFVFWYLGSYKVDAGMASLSTATMPVATVIIAWMALGEMITWIQFLGMVLVMASIVVYARNKSSA